MRLSRVLRYKDVAYKAGLAVHRDGWAPIEDVCRVVRTTPDWVMRVAHLSKSRSTPRFETRQFSGKMFVRATVKSEWDSFEWAPRLLPLALTHHHVGAAVDSTSGLVWSRTSGLVWSSLADDSFDDYVPAAEDPHGSDVHDDNNNNVAPLVVDLSSGSDPGPAVDVAWSPPPAPPLPEQQSQQEAHNAAVAAAVQEVIVCPITHDIMKDPVVAADGHTYDRPAIQLWLQKRQKSPMTNEPLDDLNLVSNIRLRQLIELFIQAVPGGGGCS